MNTAAKLIILSVLMSLSVVSTSMADKLCLQTKVNKKTFKVTNKRVIAPACPKGYTELADTSSFQGPAGATGATGATGARGAAGLLNLGACRLQSGTCYHSSGVNSCTVNCNDGEFALQYTHTSVGNGCTVNPRSNTASYSLVYSNGLGAGIILFSSAICNYDVNINVLCCPTS